MSPDFSPMTSSLLSSLFAVLILSLVLSCNLVFNNICGFSIFCRPKLFDVMGQGHVMQQGHKLTF
jgi:hypothetical protein